MNILLLFFALPIATIILSIALQKLIRCPILVAAIFFAIYLIVAFSAFDADFLVFVIAYTLLSFITAVLTKLISKIIARLNIDDEDNNTGGENGNNGCGCRVRVTTSNLSNNANVSETNCINNDVATVDANVTNRSKH